MATTHELMMELKEHDEELVSEYQMEIMLLTAENNILRNTLMTMGKAVTVSLDQIRNISSTTGADTTQ